VQTQCGSVQQQVREECVLVDLFAHAAPLRCDCTDALVPLPFNSLRPLEATYCPLFVGSIPGAEHLDKCRHVLATHAFGMHMRYVCDTARYRTHGRTTGIQIRAQSRQNGDHEVAIIA